MTTIAAWDDEYARISRAASQLRTTPQNGYNQQNPTARNHQKRSVQSGLARLKSSLMTMRNSGLVNSADVQRRIGLIDNLEQSSEIQISPRRLVCGVGPLKYLGSCGGSYADSVGG